MSTRNIVQYIITVLKNKGPFCGIEGKNHYDHHQPAALFPDTIGIILGGHMPVAEIIAIGTELLLGEIQDTNTKHIARRLRDKGIDIFRATLVGDNSSRIANLICEAAQRADIIVTTGGLGPTIDDPTRDAAALAMGVSTVFNPELWQQIEARFQRMGRIPTENNRRQAYLPVGACAIENPVGTAPAFHGMVGDTLLVCLPGVPREMEFLLENAVIPLLEDRFKLTETIRAIVLHCAGVGESQVDEWIGDLETCPNPTVGLLAHPGIVDIRITAKAASQREADDMIANMATKVHERVGHVIFGQDSDTLESVVAGLLHARGFTLYLAMDGIQSPVVERLRNAGIMPMVSDRKSPFDLNARLKELQQEVQHTAKAVGVCFTSDYSEGEKRTSLNLSLVTRDLIINESRQYAGPEGNFPLWASNFALNFLRVKLQKYYPDKE